MSHKLEKVGSSLVLTLGGEQNGADLKIKLTRFPDDSILINLVHPRKTGSYTPSYPVSDDDEMAALYQFFAKHGVETPDEHIEI